MGRSITVTIPAGSSTSEVINVGDANNGAILIADLEAAGVGEILILPVLSDADPTPIEWKSAPTHFRVNSE